MRYFFYFFLGVSACYYFELNQFVLFTVGNAKIYFFDILYTLGATYSIYNYSKLRLALTGNSIAKALFLIVAVGVFNSIVNLPKYGFSSFGEQARGEYYVVFVGLFVLVLYQSEEMVADFFRIIYRISVIVAAVKLGQFVWELLSPRFGQDEWLRFADPGIILVALGINYIVIDFFQNKVTLKRILLLLFLVSVLLLSQFRTMWVASVVALFVVIITQIKAGRSALKIVTIASTIAISVFVTVKFLVPGDLSESFGRSARVVQDLSEDPDWQWRLLVWGEYIAASSNSPIMGNGFGAPLPTINPASVTENIPAHNGWIMIFFNQGILGLIPNLVAHVVVFIFLFKLLRSSGTTRSGAYVVANLIGFQTIQLLYTISYTDNIYLWIPAGLTAVLYQHYARTVSRATIAVLA